MQIYRRDNSYNLAVSVPGQDARAQSARFSLLGRSEDAPIERNYLCSLMADDSIEGFRVLDELIELGETLRVWLPSRHR